MKYDMYPSSKLSASFRELIRSTYLSSNL